jgi:hypothetical protein
MKRVHVAISVENLSASIEDYNRIFDTKPSVIVPDIYALWRTDIINFSINQNKEISGSLRHLGFEDSEAEEFSEKTDVNQIVWEKFSADQQMQEIITIHGNNPKTKIY